MISRIDEWFMSDPMRAIRQIVIAAILVIIAVWLLAPLGPCRDRAFKPSIFNAELTCKPTQRLEVREGIATCVCMP